MTIAVIVVFWRRYREYCLSHPPALLDEVKHHDLECAGDEGQDISESEKDPSHGDRPQEADHGDGNVVAWWIWTVFFCFLLGGYSGCISFQPLQNTRVHGGFVS